MSNEQISVFTSLFTLPLREAGVTFSESPSQLTPLPIITARKRNLRRLCFRRCLFVHRGEVSAPLHAGIHPPGQVHPPGRYTPGRYTPWVGTALAGTLPLSRHPPAQCMLGYDQQVAATHPSGMHSCFIILLRDLCNMRFPQKKKNALTTRCRRCQK